MKKNCLISFMFCALLVFCGQAGAQNISNRGRDFWVGYGHHQFMEPGQSGLQQMILYFSAEEAATVTVTVRGITATQVTTYNVPANSVVASNFMPKTGTTDVRLYDLPPSFGGNGGERIFHHSIHIESNVPIVAYAHIFGSVSSGATMLLPTESWGYTYTTLNSQQNDAAGPGFSWVYVVSKENNTRVRVTPSAITRLGKPAGVPFDTTLQRGEILQIVGQGDNSGNGVQFSGTTVKSIGNAAGECFPIGVFAGSSRTVGERDLCGTGSGRDNDMQQCFPQQAWGKKYLTAPFSRSTGSTTNPNILASSFQNSVYKIAVKDPATVVRVNGNILNPATLINNSYYKYLSGTADRIESDQPVMVAQFMSQGSLCSGGSGHGDPEMVYLSPIEQAIKKVGFYRNDREAIYTNYVTVIIPTPGVASLKIDGSAVFNHTYPHPNAPGYSIVIKGWASNQAQATMVSDSGFTAITYGLGGAESYAYNAGTFLNNLNAVGSIYNTSDTSSTTTSHPFTCTATPVKLSVLLRYPTPPTRLVWRLSAVGGGLAPNADITDNAPTPVGTAVVNGISYFKYELPGTYTFTTAGTYTVPILATHPSIDNCNNTEEVSYTILVKGKPATDFAINHTGCLLDTVHFVGQNTSANGFTLNQWRYTFHDATTSISKDTAKLYAAPGTYNVALRVVSTEGCVGDTVKQVVIGGTPVASFTADDPTVCQGTAINFNSTTSYTGISNYYWDFGDGTVINTASPAPQSHTYSSYGTFTVRHSISVGPVCVSDTTQQVVTVSALPTTSFTYPAGCLPASGLVQFTSTATTPDGQAITGHSWNFGDPASGANNTSTLPNPTHTYPTFGSYTITYTVTTANSCSKDTTVNATFNLAPTFNYPALAAVCENVAGTVSVATATVTNAVPGSGVYHGTATSAAGQFNPSVAGPGTFTIWYVFTTNANCIDSVSQTITVRAAPTAWFTLANATCLPANGNVNFDYNGTPLPGQTYLWNFGDPASGANNTSTIADPSHNYSTGPFTITLTVTANGCSRDSVINANFSVTPALAYPTLAPVCESFTGTISVATASVTNAVAGTGVYSGTGVDAAGNFNPSLAGAGTHTITYTFTSTGNCTSTITQTILVNAKPRASFTYPTAACLPANGVAQFTYNGTVQPGQTYLWNFGDPASGANNTSTIANPSHVYTNTGNYTVLVTVTNANGCTDDSTLNATFSVTPALAYPALNAVCQNVTGTISVATATVTNGVTGTGVYSGPGVDAGGNFNPSLAGPGTHTITYTFTSSGNCVSSITRTIVVNPAPDASFSVNTAACLPASGIVSFNYTGTAVAGQTYLWNFGDPASGANNTSTQANPTHNYSTGSFTISLQVSAPNSCVKDSVITRNFSVTPALAYPALAPVCESVTGTVSVATATVTNGVPGTGIYSGPGVDANGNFSPSAAGPGTHNITYTFTSTGNCITAIMQTILVNAKPRASFTYPTAACLPASGVAQFTYNGTAQPGQTYLWNFGDPASGANNTSTIANPTHTYTNTGNYAVVVTVTNANGCTDDSTLNATFSVTPALAYPTLAPVCESVVGTISVATATVTNGVTGTGVYTGPGVDASGNFSPSVAGPGTHTITYTFTSSGNCITPITQTIVVNAKAAAAFNATASVCAGTAVAISNIASANINSWKWIFGDGNTTSYTNNTNFSYQYANAGSYEIKLVTTNANGCNSDTARQRVTVNPVPVASFTMPAAVCMPGGTASFTNTSTLAGGGTLSYSWNFNDGSPASTATNPAHVFTAVGSYNVTLRATSAAGCFKDSTQTFSAFFQKPVAAFTVNPASVCQGVDNIFTDASTAPGSSIKTRLWIFGDGTTSAQTNPVKRYSQPGTYTVKLVVTNTADCISDTFPTQVRVYLQPVIDAGPSFVVAQGSLIRFAPTVNDSSRTTFLWSPATGLSNPAVLRPTLTATTDQAYTLTATGEGNCTATDMHTVTIVRPVIVPNAFSPNGDATNDTWIIENIADYPNAVVEVFNRYGQMVYSSTGYSRPWDGTSKGKPLPVATYYYVINLKNGLKPLNGGITIIR